MVRFQRIRILPKFRSFPAALALDSPKLSTLTPASHRPHNIPPKDSCWLPSIQDFYGWKALMRGTNQTVLARSNPSTQGKNLIKPTQRRANYRTCLYGCMYVLELSQKRLVPFINQSIRASLKIRSVQH